MRPGRFCGREWSRDGNSLRIKCKFADFFNRIMKNIKSNVYESPVTEVIDLCFEGVLCGSNEHVGENDGEW